MAGFIKEGSSAYGIPGFFAEKKLRRCPVCGAESPEWLIREEWKLLGSFYHFHCPSCGSILRVAKDDVTGMSFTTHTFAGQMKKYKGKENKVVYIQVEKVSLDKEYERYRYLNGQELTLDELKKLMKEAE